MTQKVIAGEGSRKLTAGQSSLPRKYCFQAWHYSDSPVSETHYNNRAMARYLKKHLNPHFAKLLKIEAATPVNKGQVLMLPRTVYVSVRQARTFNVNEEDEITAFRDIQFGDLIKVYFQIELRKTLDCYNCFIRRPYGRAKHDYFATIMIERDFYKGDSPLQTPRASWSDIFYELLAINVPWHLVADLGTAALSYVESDSSKNDRPKDGKINVAGAVSELSKWLRQFKRPNTVATAGTANSYCQFKKSTETFVESLKSLVKTYKESKDQGSIKDISTIWKQLIHADATRRHGQDLVNNLDQTGLLNTVVKTHTTKSIGCGIGCVGGVGVAVTCSLIIAGTTITIPCALGVIGGGVVACFLGKWSLKYWQDRGKVIDVKVEFDSFLDAWHKVVRVLALRIAVSAGAVWATENPTLRDNFLRRFGLDSDDSNNEKYTMESLGMRVQYLEKQFEQFTKNMDEIDKENDLGLSRGVEAT